MYTIFILKVVHHIIYSNKNSTPTYIILQIQIKTTGNAYSNCGDENN